MQVVAKEVHGFNHPDMPNGLVWHVFALREAKSE